ncbi:MAG: hypothetical protein CMB99_15710 [Flavobacteriaceae bacterium]|nr:hypothetical protein [Flavobacteriaceae bacterium]
MDAVPEEFRSLYSEKDGKAVLTGISGIKTPQDVLNVQEALRKERENHSAAREALKPWKALGEDPAEIQAKLDRIGELEAAAEGKLDESAIQKLVEQRLGQKTAPLERQLKETTSNLEELKSENEKLKNTLVTRDRNDAIRSVATEMKVLPTAIADVELVAGLYLERDETTGEFIVKADANGVTPGADIRQFMKEMQKLRPHWWPQSQGGGAGGSKGTGDSEDNPWSKNGWSITKQGEYIKQNGMSKAQEAAKSVGSFVGATRPPEPNK